jgi:hypothetical protein
MKAFELKKSIEALLESNARGRYAVIGAKRKSEAADIFAAPQVSVFYADGSFDKRKSGVNSPYHHDAAFNIHILVAAKAKVNLAVLQNPAATPDQLAAALAESDNAAIAVDEKMEQIIDTLFDIIMSPVNADLGTDCNPGRWITQIKKHNQEPVGAIVTAVASMTLAAQAEEEVSGEEGTPGGGIDTMIDLGDESRQGVTT